MVEVSGFISLQYGNRKQGFSLKGRARETYYGAQVLGTDSSSYFSLEAMFLMTGQGVRKEKRDGNICPGEEINQG